MKAAALFSTWTMPSRSIWKRWTASARQAESAKAAADAEQVQAMEAFGDASASSPRAISPRGVSDALPSSFASMTQTYNAAVETLEGALGHVNQSAARSATVSAEISVASDDLSSAHRTAGRFAGADRRGPVRRDAGNQRDPPTSRDGRAPPPPRPRRMPRRAARSSAVPSRPCPRSRPPRTKIGKIIGVIDEIAFQPISSP